ncbi:OmpA family protein [Polymorphobacter sp.]|uniref:OmpA family protein n=1 Tax=Polymorphobacter sp. TaxID=1909290 RepID=UPI003F6FE795
MRKLLIGAALATTMLASGAQARDKSWYVGVGAGANLMQNQVFDIRNAAGTVTTTDAIRNKYEIGFDAGGNIGYDFGPFRAEFEVAYKDNNLDVVNIDKVIPAIRMFNGSPRVPGVGAYPGADGNARVLSFMANGLLDFGGQERNLGAYVGGGAGVARVQLSDLQTAKFGQAFINDTDTGFAWQVLAGVYKPISDHVDLGLKYRFFNVPDVKTFTTNGLETESKYRSHSLMVTLAYNFFTAEAPPPPPPPPAPPAPPPAPLPPCPPAAVTPGPFLVFFDWDKSLVTAEAAAILDRAAEQYAATGQTSIALAGHADKSGADDYNVRLSQRRADAVKAYMVGKGVPESVIATEAFGESRPLVETADGVREPQNRRVEITFSGAPVPADTGPCRPM